MGEAASTRRHTLAGLGLCLLVTLVCLLSLELAVRRQVTCDVDANCVIQIRGEPLALRPHRLPVRDVAEMIDQYRASASSYLQYDAQLGWAPRPQGASENGLYHANEDGARAATTTGHAHDPKQGLRVVLLGDSYVHGDEIPFGDSLGPLLEHSLAAAGLPAEVVNLGCPAYGMDQALLRWKSQGRGFAPDVVVFGFQPENAKRNLNLLRMLYHGPSRIPFSKPRFVLEAQGLRLLNAPTVPPEDLPDLFAHLDAWPERTHESFYRPEHYAVPPWSGSKLLALAFAWTERSRIRQRKDSDEEAFFAPGGEASRLALAIVAELERDVRAHGARLLVPLLVPQWDFHFVRRGRAPPYADLFAVAARRFETVATAERLRASAETQDAQDLFAGHHYSGKANRVVAAALAEAILEDARAH